MAGLAGAQPDYDRDNPISTLAQRAASISLAGGESLYVRDSLHSLFPLVSFGLPSEDPSIAHDGRPSTQEALRRYQLGDYYVVKGLLRFGGSPRNFVRVGYAPASRAATPLRLEIEIGSVSRKLTFPFLNESGEYAVEFWSVSEAALTSLPAEVRAATTGGGVVLDAAFPPGNPLDYQASRLKGTAWETGDPNDVNHPLRPAPLKITIAGSAGPIIGPHKLGFKMIRRGFEAFRSDRFSNNTHGGTGTIEGILFYNAEANDPDHIERRRGAEVERLFPAKYMQYVRFGPGASIGIHRHKENLDAFWVTRGSGLGVVIDAVALDGTERTVELRRLRAFEGMIVRPGQMHGLLRDTEEPLEMFAFGAAN